MEGVGHAPGRVAVDGAASAVVSPLFEVRPEKARLAGLRRRPIAEALDPLLKWDRSRRETDLTGGLTVDQEDRLLAKPGAASLG